MGKAWQHQFWMFSASLRTIPASDCPKKIYFGCYQIYCLCLSGTVQDGKVELFFVKGTQNLVNMFTKNLEHIKFLKFREQLGLEFYLLK